MAKIWRTTFESSHRRIISVLCISPWLTFINRNLRLDKYTVISVGRNPDHLPLGENDNVILPVIKGYIGVLVAGVVESTRQLLCELEFDQDYAQSF